MEKNEIICLDSLQLTNNDLFVRVSTDSLSKNAELVVNDTHSAVIIKDGQMMNTLDSGRYKIFSKEDKHDIKTVDVIYMSKTAKLRVLWGTKNRLCLKDPITGAMFELGANGEFEIRIANPRQVYLQLIGADKNYTVDKLKDRLLGRIMATIEPTISEIMTQKQLSYVDLAPRKAELAAAVKPVLSQMFETEYGLEILSFTIATVFVPAEYIRKLERERMEPLIPEWKAETVTAVAEDEDYIICKSCGAKCAVDDKFCAKCGEKLFDVSKVCACGFKNDADAVFCASCGKKL